MAILLEILVSDGLRIASNYLCFVLYLNLLATRPPYPEANQCQHQQEKRKPYMSCWKAMESKCQWPPSTQCDKLLWKILGLAKKYIENQQAVEHHGQTEKAYELEQTPERLFVWQSLKARGMKNQDHVDYNQIEHLLRRYAKTSDVVVRMAHVEATIHDYHGCSECVHKDEENTSNREAPPDDIICDIFWQCNSAI